MHRPVLQASIVVACSLFASQALADAPPPPAPTAPAPPAAVEPGPMVNVHIETPEPVELEVQRGSEWISACTSPCDRVLSTKESYRINGSGIRTSKAFRIQDTGVVKLEVEPESSAGHTIAIVLVVTGGAGLVPGLGVTGVLVGGLLFGLILICPIVAAFSSDGDHAYGECLGDIAVEVGKLYASPFVWVPAAGGLALILGGGAWLASSSGTQVRVSTPAKTGALRSSGLQRVPSWQTVQGATSLAAALPPVVTMPLVRFEF